MKAHVILLIGKQWGGREGEKRKKDPVCAFDAEHLFAEFSFLLQASYPQSQAGQSPCDIALFWGIKRGGEETERSNRLLHYHW